MFRTTLLIGIAAILIVVLIMLLLRKRAAVCVELDETLLAITVTNIGHRAITVQMPQLELPDGTVLHYLKLASDSGFPCTLGPQESCRCTYPRRDLENALLWSNHAGCFGLNARVRESGGSTFRSATPCPLDLNAYMGDVQHA